MWPFDRRPASPPAAKRPPRPRQLHPTPMTEAELSQLRVQGEMDQAHLQATRAYAELESISSDRLQNVLRLPRAERTTRIDDPELLPADRQTLIESLARDDVKIREWRPTPNSSRRDTLLRLWGHNRHRAPTLIRALILFGPVCIFAVTAYRNTGERIVGIPSSEVRFWKPNGDTYTATIGGKESIVLVRHFGEYHAREWKRRQAYALAPVDTNW